MVVRSTIVLTMFVLVPAAVFALRLIRSGQNAFYTPSWAPDGSQLVFEQLVDGKSVISRIATDGSGLRQLTDTTVNGGQPRWSPDGKSIVFSAERGGRFRLFLMNTDGSGQRALTASDADDINPDVSPDGKYIAFMSAPHGDAAKHDIFIVRADGSERTRVTDGQADYVGPRWQPDGAGMVFTRGTGSNATEEIAVASRDGTSMRGLTHNNDRDYRATWSHDGRTIYFLTRRDGSPAVYAMNADGTAQHKVADGAIVTSPSVSPDDRFFAYAKLVGGKPGIYIYEIATGKERLVIGK
jgi:TolB protein